MFKQLARLAIPVTATVGFIGHTGFDAVSAKEKRTTSENPLKDDILNLDEKNCRYFPIEKQWDTDWDLRSPTSLIRPKKWNSASEEEKAEMIKKVTPTATRNIFLIRHGQYQLSTSDKFLTELGKKQAAILGKRLESSEVKFDKQLARLAIPVTATVGFIGHTGFDAVSAKEKRTTSENPLKDDILNLDEKNCRYFPIEKQWDTDWDLRSPTSLIRPKKWNSASEEKKAEMIKKVTPTATRNIFLIRHGQYQLSTSDKFLTELGKKQAAILGKRLESSEVKFDKVTYSTMNRATETAKIMMSQMKELPSSSDVLLEEGAPYPPVPAVSHWKPHNKEFFVDGARIETAFRKYIHRADPEQEKESFELIVCHANVIRFFICRALQLPPEAWLRMSLGNSSITWLVIRPSGNVSIRSIGDIGHLDKDTLTFT
uniref:Serine/threonine-protein phosphatase PGAM5, mitochondrial n=1 Tax=Rhabditophanes sp. KR3021 TaxID=114890 RepID=A0AC35U1J0_9BILA